MHAGTDPSFQYITSDIPPEMTIDEYRRKRTGPGSRRPWLVRLRRYQARRSLS